MGAFLLVYINAFLAFDFGQFLMGLKLVTDWVVPEISQKMGFLQVKNKTVFSPFLSIFWYTYLPKVEYTEGKRHCRTLKKKPIKFSKTFKTRNAFFNLPNIYGVFKNPKQNFRVPNLSLYLKCLRRSLDLSRFFFATGLTNAIFFHHLKTFLMRFSEIVRLKFGTTPTTQRKMISLKWNQNLLCMQWTLVQKKSHFSSCKKVVHMS